MTWSSWAPRAGVQLRKGQSPSSSPAAGREAARARSQTWPPWRTAAPLLPLGFLGWGSRAGLLPPGGYLRTPPSPRPARSATARGLPDTERARGTLETSSRRARPAGRVGQWGPEPRCTPG